MANDDWLKELLNPPPPKNPFDFSEASDPFGAFAPTPPLGHSIDPIVSPLNARYPSPFGMLGVPPTVPSASTRLANVLAQPQLALRRVYFAFSFDDIIRVNNVRMQGKVGSREAHNPRLFADRSIWERRNIANEENLKDLMRKAMRYSSVICVTVGTRTWNSRWAKYEIARSVVDDKGLFAVHINSINHNHTKTPDLLGINPLHMMGIWRNENETLYLVERHPVVVNAATAELGWEWRYYQDYKDPLKHLPKYIWHLGVNEIAVLSRYTAEYDMMRDGGFKNMGAWIDTAAAQVGR
jgi:hypothetical protein